MKKHLLRLGVYAVLLTLLLGCTPVTEQSPTGPIVLSDQLLALLETVNQEHQSIVKPEIDEAEIVERWARDPSKYSLDYQIAGSMIDGVLTVQQAKNDVNVLFHNLQTKYGLYEYFGGDAAFDAAKEEILQACDEAGTLTPQELVDVLMAKLAFVKDGHFFIDNLPVASMIFPFHYRDVAFEKTETGYQTLETKPRIVASVDGYDDLDSLFHRSLADDGAIVYYPVIMVEEMAQDFWRNNDFSPKFSPEDLVVRFQDGSSQLLAAEPYSLGVDIEKPLVELYENQSIPVLFSRSMGNITRGDQHALAFLAYGEQLRGEPVLILDLRSNGGGAIDLPFRWAHAYTGQDATGNVYGVVNTSGFPANFTDSPDTWISSWRQIKGGISLWGVRPDEIIANDNLVIVLTGNYTASSAELLIDLLYNLSNVLFIGDNTAGCLLTDTAFAGANLPHSLIRVQFGKGAHVFPDKDYFQEMRGFLPDLWVPAAQAEELALKLLFKGD